MSSSKEGEYPDLPTGTSLRHFANATTGFPDVWGNERRNTILMTCHYPDLDSASDWLKEISLATPPDLGSVASVWNFCARFSGVISRENLWWRPEMSAVFLS